MNHTIRFRCLLAVLAAGLLLSACSQGESADETAKAAIVSAEASVRKTVLVANPEGAADAIYASFDKEPALTGVTDQMLTDEFGIELDMVEDYVAYTSDAKSGLCDLAIILPAGDNMDVVRDALYQYQANRIEQFRNYDILGSLDIAQNAIVYSQGDYVIMLMLADNEAAQVLIDQYMPQ